MRLPAKTLRASLLALVLASVLSAAAAEREKSASLIGLTKDQAVAKLGDPRSNIRAGQREVLYFTKVKLTLRNNVVIEAEDVVDETSTAPAPKREAAPAPAPASEGADQGDTAKTRKQPAPQPTAPTPAPVAPAPAEPAAKTAEISEPKSAPAAPAFVEIKAVRPLSNSANRGTTPPKPATKSTSTTPPVPGAPAQGPANPPATTPPAIEPKPVAVTSTPALTSTAVTTPSAGPTPMPVTSTPPPATAEPAAETVAVATPPVPSTVEEKKDAEKTEEAPKPAPKKKRRFFRPLPDDEGVTATDIFTTQTVVFALLAVGAMGFLFWRGRQRKLLLAATTVSNTPFVEAAAADTGALFTADLLSKLEWKRFEELVAAYYVKTGVIAVRTKTGPESPVHLKISWKGEAKPFACVQCHSNPVGLIKPAPLQALHAELTTAEIRRGYVVTNGKFNVEARDFAEEKHFTLLPGDILLEKLNALPPAARAELLQQTTAGDYTTATCPKCDTKMHRAEGGWRCAKCETFLPGKA